MPKAPTPQTDSMADLYRPSSAVEETTKLVYDELDDMIAKRTATYPEFNNRILTTYIDDGDKRLNALTLPRESYDPPKEGWQSNVAMPTIKDKQMKILAGFALEPPDMALKTYYQGTVPDVDRAEVAKWLIVGSYMSDQNPNLQAFWETWEAASRGTVVKYEGYMRTKLPQKFITSYNLETGEIEYDEREVTVDDRCISYIVPLTEFYIKSFYVHDVQDQDKIAWVRLVSKDRAEMEFSKNPNWKYVKTKKQLGNFSNADTQSYYFKTRWDTRVGENDYEIVRYYCKSTDSYIVIVNGVLMMDVPLLWKFNGRKIYPFAKSIWMPFVNEKFFYGQSHPDHMTGLYDEYNTLWNTMTDKQYRSMVRAMLVGRVNGDAFLLEDDYVTGSTKITVEDVSQVKMIDADAVNNSDVTMLKIVAQAMDEAAPSVSSLIGNKKATAREVVIANDRLNEMKSLYSEMIVDLWRQKYQIRLANIQQNYPVPREVYDKESKTVKKEPRTYIIEGATLDSQTGEQGTLAIRFENVAAKNKQKVAQELAVTEEQMKQKGIAFRSVIVPTDYLDNIDTQIMVQASSVFKQSQAYKQSTFIEKLDILQKAFPQYFLAMGDQLISQMASAYGDNPATYSQAKKNLMMQMAQAQAAKAGGGGQGGPGAPTPAEGSSTQPPAPGAPAPAPAQGPTA